MILNNNNKDKKKKRKKEEEKKKKSEERRKDSKKRKIVKKKEMGPFGYFCYLFFIKLKQEIKLWMKTEWKHFNLLLSLRIMNLYMPQFPHQLHQS